MAVEHRNIPESGLHEPKGVSTSASDRVYISDGSGSGAWSKVASAALQGTLGDTPDSGRFVVTDGSGGLESQEEISSDDIDYDGATLTATIVSLLATISSQQDEIDDLEARVTALESA